MHKYESPLRKIMSGQGKTKTCDIPIFVEDNIQNDDLISIGVTHELVGALLKKEIKGNEFRKDYQLLNVKDKVKSVPTSSSLKMKVTNTKYDSKKIFIVHGHDNVAKLELEGLLARLGLQPVILHQLPDKGRTIIEKFEEESQKIGYAFILLTPDDSCLGQNERKNGKNKSSDEKRARQNVVLELGFFIGRLGRERVCALYKEGVVIPTDYSGVLYKKFRLSVDELYQEIRKELVSAGYKIKKY